MNEMNSGDEKTEDSTTSLKLRLLSASPYFLFGAILTGLGYVHEARLQAQDEILEEHLTVSQKRQLYSAVVTDNCDLLKPRFERLCMDRESSTIPRYTVDSITPDDLPDNELGQEFEI